jgi:pimeloyl-ACP methyl ester carboxylesterase
MLNLAAVPVAYFLILAFMLVLILSGLLLKFRARNKAGLPRQRRSLTTRGFLVGFLRLSGFGLLSFLLIGGVLIIFVDYQTLKSDLAPAFRSVDLPPGLPFAVEEVSFPGGGVRLAGWYVPPENGATIILLHGYGGTRASMLWHAKVLVEAGYGVLLYDERASGESGGSRRSYGWEDGPDVSGAVAFLKERDGDTPSRIGICGCSMGGQIALQGAILNPEIAAAWADGASMIRAVDMPPPHNILTGLSFVASYLLDFMQAWQMGIPAPDPMIDRISSIAPRQVMLVGGGKERGLWGSEAPRINRYARFAGSNAQVWIIEDAVHCEGPAKHPQEYARRMFQFFDAALHMEERP